MTHGHVLEEHDWPDGRRRTIFTKYNAKRRSGYDVQRQKLYSCALCPKQEWVPALSRNTRWTVTNHSRLMPDVHYCPEHASQGRELDKTLQQLLRDEALDIITRVRERIPNGPANPDQDTAQI